MTKISNAEELTRMVQEGGVPSGENLVLFLLLSSAVYRGCQGMKIITSTVVKVWCYSYSCPHQCTEAAKV